MFVHLASPTDGKSLKTLASFRAPLILNKLCEELSNFSHNYCYYTDISSKFQLIWYCKHLYSSDSVISTKSVQSNTFFFYYGMHILYKKLPTDPFLIDGQFYWNSIKFDVAKP